MFGYELRLWWHRFLGETLDDVEDLSFLRRLLASKAHEPNEVNSQGETALNTAVYRNHFAYAVELLKAGADPDRGESFNKAAEFGIFSFLPLFLYYKPLFSRKKQWQFNADYLIRVRWEGVLGAKSIRAICSPEIAAEFQEHLPHLRKRQEQAIEIYETIETQKAENEGQGGYDLKRLMDTLQQDSETANHLYHVVQYENTLLLRYQRARVYSSTEPFKESLIRSTQEALAYFAKEILRVLFRMSNYFDDLPSETTKSTASKTSRFFTDCSPVDLTQEALVVWGLGLTNYLDKDDEECQAMMRQFNKLDKEISTRERAESGSSTEPEEIEMVSVGRQPPGYKLKMD